MLTSASPEIFDEYARRQYVAKAPQRNPFGVEEEPIKFNDMDTFTKIRVLHQLSVWTLGNADRIKDKMGLTEKQQTSWVSNAAMLVGPLSNTRSASKSLDGTRTTGPTTSSTTTVCTVAAPSPCRPRPEPNPNPNLNPKRPEARAQASAGDFPPPTTRARPRRSLPWTRAPLKSWRLLVA